jgi:hypothetical protein
MRVCLSLSFLISFLFETILALFAVSHTTDDMVFQWDPDVPLVVDENIELPQLQLVKNKTDDCSQVYSTGEFTLTRIVKSSNVTCSKYSDISPQFFFFRF